MQKKHLSFLVLCLWLYTGCGIYSFTGTSIHPDAKTVSVETFPNLASLVAPTLSQTLTEKLRDKFTAETRLDLIVESGDVEFTGAIINYFVTPAASGADDQAAFSKLTLAIRVDYLNTITGEKWSQKFQQFENFDENVNLSSVENNLIETLTERLATDVFNKAFTNW